MFNQIKIISEIAEIITIEEMIVETTVEEAVEVLTIVITIVVIVEVTKGEMEDQLIAMVSLLYNQDDQD